MKPVALILRRWLLPRLAVTTALFSLFCGFTTRLQATVVDTLTGGPWQGNPLYYGYQDGDTIAAAQFHTPYGLALDGSGEILFVADRDNDAVRELDIPGNMTYTFVPNPYVSTNLISKPVGVAVYGNDVFVLNRGNGNNGTVLQFDIEFAELIATNATGLTNAAGMTIDSVGNIYVTVQNNTLKRISPFYYVTNVVSFTNIVANTNSTFSTNITFSTNTVTVPTATTNVSTIATITNAGTSLQGLAVKHSGLIAVCDSGRHGVYLINPTNGVVTTNAGFHGAGDFSNTSRNSDSSSNAKFNQPYGVAVAGDDTLIVTDTSNHRVKLVLTSGTVTNLYGVRSNLWVPGPGTIANPIFPGWYDGTVHVPDQLGGIESRMPVGVAFASDGSLYVTEDYYHLIRKITGTGLVPPPPPAPFYAPTILTVTTKEGQVSLTWSTVAGATSYNVKRSQTSGGPFYATIASTSDTSYTDNSVVNGTTYYYVVSAANAGGESTNSAQVTATPPLPPVPDPQIGYVTFPPPLFSSVFHPGSQSGQTFNNNVDIVIIGTLGSETHYTYANTLVLTNVPDPITNFSTAPVGYQDGLGNVIGLTVASIAPALTIKAIGVQTNHQDSGIVSALFQFIVGNPFIVGNNAGQFRVGDITEGAQLWYTIDGSDPTNSFPSLQAGIPISGTNTLPLSLSFPPGSTSNMIFKIRGFKANYQPSGIVSAQFSPTNFVANTISFGFNGGEASSDFVAAPGQNFYAPVTLTLLSEAKMYSLQFNITVTNQLPITNITVTNVIGINTTNGNVFTTNVTVVTNVTGILTGYVTNMADISTNLTITSVTGIPANLTIITNVTGITTSVNTTPPVAPGAVSFQSMLEKPIPGITPVVYETLPPAMFVAGALVPNPVIFDHSTNFSSLLFVNSTNNLLGVGWVERYQHTNLFDTIAQDLITYSQAHDTLFLSSLGKVVVGGYSFTVPGNATTNSAYQIQIGRPSATADGIGMPGSDVYIATPTNGSLAGGAINSIKNVAVGQRKYLVGDVYPFRWFNAGDFGQSNLVSADVVQVFQSGIYGNNYPPFDENSWSGFGFTNVSDFFDAMDSCGNLGVNNGSGIYTNAGAYTAANPSIVNYCTTNFTYYYDINDALTNIVASPPICVTFTNYSNVNLFTVPSYNTNIHTASTNVVLVTNTFSFFTQTTNLFNGNDSTINQVVFGDGVLDVCDVYVTFRRSLDPSLTWFRRFWQSGQRVADTITNVAPHSKTVATSSPTVKSKDDSADAPQVNFAAGDAINGPGQTVFIPITANTLGNYPLRVLMLNLTVEPLDGSPAITTPVQFTPAPALGTPYTTSQQGANNYSAVWLNSTITGLTGNASIGTLQVTLPANAPASAAYAVHFDHASGSPNGIASFSKTTFTGLITLADRSASLYGDGIPDSWRLRWFGTVYNLLSVSNACPTGDGVNNWKKYVAGVDPNIANDFPSTSPKTPVPAGATTAIHWPSVFGKQYVIERSSSLFSGWNTIATNIGTGGDMEFDDTNTGSPLFYRVLILP